MAKKSNIIRRVEEVNEKELLAALAGFGDEETVKAPSSHTLPPSPVSEPVADIERNEREDKVSLPTEAIGKKKQGESYMSTFLNPKELKMRQCVYISLDLHETILAIVNEIAVKGMTVGAFIDTVLRQHLEEHKAEINNLYRRRRDDLIK